ncbi:MAG: beta-glucosidase BglX [Acidobacteria bacterium]|nr:beta-glucosidase BglX [Acidobacteriota bacterium]
MTSFVCRLPACVLLSAFFLPTTPSVAQTHAAHVTNRVSSADAKMERFVSALMAKMTPREKIMQMEQAAGHEISSQKADELAREGVGSFLFVTDPARIHALQKIAVTESRLHIPLIFGYDVIHGYHTIFPVPIALASSWDPGLVERVQSAAAREARANGIHWAFTPMVDIARDPRWGRIMEGAGEDPYLGEQMAAAQVRGLQGPVVGGPHNILACVKHFAAYGDAVGGRDYDSVEIPETALRNVYLRPYHAAVKAGAATVMSAYQDLNDVPATGNVWLMREILRKEWGFKGFVVSDWEAVKSLQIHGFAASQEDAAVRAVKAGINMEMTSTAYADHLEDALKKGEVTLREIDDLVRPILEMKYRLGLFDNPYIDLNVAKQETDTPAAHALSQKAAEQSSILLRNEDHALPLSKSIGSLAVIGPLADAKMSTKGSWSQHGDPNEVITVAEGLREKLPNAKISVTKGVEIRRFNASVFDAQMPEPAPTLLTEEARNAEFQHAVDLAKQADVTVLVLGELQNMNGEHASRAELTLPGKQEQLMEAIVATGKPVVLVLMSGRPMDITWASKHVPAILNVWYPGTEGGRAVANLLMGDANPGGHLTVTWPRSVGQVPIYYNDNTTQLPEEVTYRYWDEPSTPVWPFGFGLSYSTFSFSKMQVNNWTVTENAPLRVSIDVTNTSSVPGTDVVQLYTHQRAGSASRPVRELKAFRKVSLAPHETQTVTLEVPAGELRYWSGSLHRDVLEPGIFDVWLGDDSTAKNHAEFHVKTVR